MHNGNVSLIQPNNLLLFKETKLFDTAYKLGYDCTESILAFHVGLLSNCGMGVDRTKKSIFNFVDSPIPENTINDNFENLIYQRAHELKQKGDITLLVSGLISLVVMKTLKDVGANIEVIICDTDYQRLQNHFVDIKPKVVSVSEMLDGTILLNRFIVTGDCAKQLYTFPNYKWNNVDIGKDICLGPLMIYNSMNLGISYATRFDSPALKNFFSDKKKVFNLLNDYVNDIIEKSPVEIKTTQDFFWWINFNFKWYSRRYRYIGFTGKMIFVEPFFDTLSFQSWALNNNRKLSREKFIEILGANVLPLRSSIERKHLKNTTWLSIFADSSENIVCINEELSDELVLNVMRK